MNERKSLFFFVSSMKLESLAANVFVPPEENQRKRKMHKRTSVRSAAVTDVVCDVTKRQQANECLIDNE
jgi:hypothetical protein